MDGAYTEDALDSKHRMRRSCSAVVRLCSASSVMMIFKAFFAEPTGSLSVARPCWCCKQTGGLSPHPSQGGFLVHAAEQGGEEGEVGVGEDHGGVGGVGVDGKTEE